MQLPHELAVDFPGQTDLLHELRERDAHFRRLSDSYFELNKKVYRSEARMDTITEEEERVLRVERMKLKDEIARRLAEAA